MKQEWKMVANMSRWMYLIFCGLFMASCAERAESQADAGVSKNDMETENQITQEIVSASLSPEIGDLIITEVLASPKAGLPGDCGDPNMDGKISDPEDRFVEIGNLTGRTLDLGNVEICIDNKRLHWFKGANDILNSQTRSVVITVGGTDKNTPHYLIRKNNGAKTIVKASALVTLYVRKANQKSECAGLMLDAIKYGSSSTGTSYVRNPEWLEPLDDDRDGKVEECNTNNGCIKKHSEHLCPSEDENSQNCNFSPGTCANGHNFDETNDLAESCRCPVSTIEDVIATDQKDVGEDKPADLEVADSSVPDIYLGAKPQIGTIVINEILARVPVYAPYFLDPNQDAQLTEKDRFVEIVNQDNATLDLSQLMICVQKTDTKVYHQFGAISLAPLGTIIVLGDGNFEMLNANAPAGVVYVKRSELSDLPVTGATVSLVLSADQSCAGTPIDLFEYKDADESFVRDPELKPPESSAIGMLIKPTVKKHTAHSCSDQGTTVVKDPNGDITEKLFSPGTCVNAKPLSGNCSCQ